MPVVLRLDGFTFFFYSNEGNPREPAHIHVRRGRDEAKFWLTPAVSMSYNDGLDAKTHERPHGLCLDGGGIHTFAFLSGDTLHRGSDLGVGPAWSDETMEERD